MDYALLAATALGAIGLYLMMPRECAPLSRLGGLLAAMALAGFFLYLVRAVSTYGAVTGSDVSGGWGGPPVYFYLFAFIMVAGAVGVVTQPKPVYAALYFVLVTLAGAGTFVLLLADFMAIVLVIIYAGAILVTYVFVIMLASQGASGGAVGNAGGAGRSPEYDRRANEPFAAVMVAFLLIGSVLQVLFPVHEDKLGNYAERKIAARAMAHEDTLMRRNLGAETAVATMPGAAPAVAMVDTATAPAIVTTMTATTGPAVATTIPSNVQVLGANLYSKYPLTLELAGILLTIALIGAVVIARKNTSAAAPLGTGKLPTE